MAAGSRRQGAAGANEGREDAGKGAHPGDSGCSGGAGRARRNDFGGNGSRALVLVYNSSNPEDLYDRFGGVEGSAYMIGGVGVNFQQRENIILAPIRTGVGARLGANVGYLKYSRRPNWNPF